MGTLVEKGTYIVPDKDDGTNDFSGWYCIKFPEVFCEDCGQMWEYVHNTQTLRIAVWPDKYDRTMLNIATILHKRDFDPRVIEYEQNFGPCISYYNKGYDLH